MSVRRRGGQSLVALGAFLLVCLAGNLSGFAAGTPADHAQLGNEGHDAIGGCQSAPVQVSFQTRYDANLGDYGVSTVQLEGLQEKGSAGCAGRRFRVTLADSQGTTLAQQTGTALMTNTVGSLDVSAAHVPAADVASVRVTLVR
ncbi:MAG: hypothetical protein QOI60_1748 [Actinomycetota bacterium]|nr:hypothetical protein [Actinomycetota bacterium]